MARKRDNDSFDTLADEFARRMRRGESPEIEDYVARCSEDADDVRDLFLAIAAMENAAARLEPTTLSYEDVRHRSASARFTGTDRYRILGVLGTGGMGTVYEAYDLQLQVRVALKLLPSRRPDDLIRFKQEFRSLTELSHPSLVSLYEFFSDGEVWFFTMELIDGYGLREWLFESDSDVRWSEPSFSRESQQQPSHWERVQTAFFQLAVGIDTLHQHGRLHCDVKYGNVMVRRDGSVVLLDFGLISIPYNLPESNQVTSFASHPRWSMPTPEGLVAGTANYMAPEQVAGRRLTPACDWYAFGSMLYEALVGQPPFRGLSWEVLLKKQTERPMDPRQKLSGLPSDLVSLCLALLQIDPGHRPTGETILRILGREHSSAIRCDLDTESKFASKFVGRSDLIATFRHTWSTLPPAGFFAIHVKGPSGVGKTRLVKHFLTELQKSGEAIILIGRVYEQESMPFKALDSLVDSIADWLRYRAGSTFLSRLPDGLHALARVFPVLQRVPAIADGLDESIRYDPQELRLLARISLRKLLSAIAEIRPLVIYIDDLQWGDADSAIVLADLIDNPVDSPLRLIISYRLGTCPENPCLKAIRAEATGGPDRLDIAVPWLSFNEGVELANSLLTSSPDSSGTASRISLQSGGNPLFVIQLARHLDESKDITAESLGLEDVIGKRIGRLTRTALSLLELICVAGQPLRLKHLARALGPECSYSHDITVLRVSRLIQGSGSGPDDTFEAYHDFVRSVVSQRLTPAKRRECFQRLSVAAEELGDIEVEILGYLFEGAEEYIKAGDYFEKAARNARKSLAFERAIELYDRSLQRRPLDGKSRESLLVELAESLAFAGHGSRAAEKYLHAASAASSEDALELRQCAALQLSISGQIDRAHELYRQVLHRIGTKLPSGNRLLTILSIVKQRLRLMLRGDSFVLKTQDECRPSDLKQIDVMWGVASGMSTINTFIAASLHTQTLISALNAGEPTRIVRSLAWEAFCRGMANAASEQKAVLLLSKAEELSQNLRNRYSDGMIAFARGMLHSQMFRFSAAIKEFNSAETQFVESRKSVWWELGTVRWLRTTSFWHMGSLRRLRADTLLYSEEARRRGDDYTLSNMLAVMHPYLNLALDRCDDAKEARAEAARTWKHSGFHYQHLALQWSELQWLLYHRSGNAAHELFEANWPLVEQSLILKSQLVRTMYYDFRAVCAVSAVDRRRRNSAPLKLAKSLAAKIARDSHCAVGAFWNRVMGLIAREEGRVDDARNYLTAAANQFSNCGMKMHAASVEFALGRLLGGDEGERLVRNSIAVMQGEDVVSPESFARIHTWF